MTLITGDLFILSLFLLQLLPANALGYILAGVSFLENKKKARESSFISKRRMSYVRRVRLRRAFASRVVFYSSSCAPNWLKFHDDDDDECRNR